MRHAEAQRSETHISFAAMAAAAHRWASTMRRRRSSEVAALLCPAFHHGVVTQRYARGKAGSAHHRHSAADYSRPLHDGAGCVWRPSPMPSRLRR